MRCLLPHGGGEISTALGVGQDDPAKAAVLQGVESPRRESAAPVGRLRQNAACFGLPLAVQRDRRNYSSDGSRWLVVCEFESVTQRATARSEHSKSRRDFEAVSGADMADCSSVAGC